MTNVNDYRSLSAYLRAVRAKKGGKLTHAESEAAKIRYWNRGSMSLRPDKATQRAEGFMKRKGGERGR